VTGESANLLAPDQLEKVAGEASRFFGTTATQLNPARRRAD
jgi:hypothetical protein